MVDANHDRYSINTNKPVLYLMYSTRLLACRERQA